MESNVGVQTKNAKKRKTEYISSVTTCDLQMSDNFSSLARDILIFMND